jgi:SAM-dependent methyltransferase
VITVDFNRLDIQPGFKIIDIGCGSGRHTGAAYRYKNVTVIGADLDFNDLLDAKKRMLYHDDLGEHGGGVWGLSVSDITSLPFNDDCFDLVICSEVMEHIPDEKKAASELSRIVKPGGDLVVSVPRYFPERICWALSDDYYNANQGHVRIYRKKNLVDLFENTGVKKKGSSHFAHSIHTPYWWLKCLVGPTREDSVPVNIYNRFLTWDIMKKPRITRFLDTLLNPVLGKSIVFYFRKV